MKISLLLDREPFAEIVEETLSRYFSLVNSEPRNVSWEEGTPKISDLLDRKKGLWLCNPEINAIFSAQAGSSVFQVPWREYLGGSSLSKVLAHGGYLTAATAPVSRWFAASFHLWIMPELDNADSTLIMGGNTRMHVVDYHLRRVTTVLKSRFTADFMRRELELRTSRDDLLAPPILEVLTDNRSFVEPLIQGTNADRLFNRGRAERALLEALGACEQLAASTTQTVAGDTWVGDTLGRCRRAVEMTAHSADEEFRTALDLAASLGDSLNDLGSLSEIGVEVGMSHGDLQAGNVLVEDDKVWVIDWERADLRILEYDGLTLALDSRRERKGLVERTKQLIEGQRSDAVGQRVHERMFRSRQAPDGLRLALMFFLEEIRFCLEENASGPFKAPTPSLKALLEELGSLDRNENWNVG